jgi:uncharacterized membrane protein
VGINFSIFTPEPLIMTALLSEMILWDVNTARSSRFWKKILGALRSPHLYSVTRILRINFLFRPSPKKTEPTASGTSYGYQSGGYSAYPGDPYDHTADFDPRDISDNKVIAMLIYLMGIVGIVIALLSQNNSPYVAFHLRQALKIMVVSTLAVFIIAMLCWTVIVPLAGVCFIAALFVVKIICFFDICKGKAREPHIIRNFDFLR